MTLPLLIALSVGLAVLGLGGLIWGYQVQISSQMRRQRQIERLDHLVSADLQGGADLERQSEPSLVDRIAYMMTGRLQGNVPTGTEGEDRILLARAGYRGLQALVYFQSIRLGLTLLTFLAAASYALSTGQPNIWLKVFMVVAVSYLAPKYVLRFLAARRVRGIAAELPLFVDYLRMMNGAGVSLEQSMLLFAEEQRVGLPLMASELNMVRIAIKSGRARADAMQAMADQMGLSELQELVTLINDADRYGAGLSEPLKRFALWLTEKRRFEMQEFIGKLATRMVVVMVVFLLPALVIITAGPGFTAVYKALSKMV